MSILRADMPWPPVSLLLATKMAEHGSWYSGDTSLLKKFYSTHRNTSLAPELRSVPTFWGSQVRDGEASLTPVHVPIAGDIAETSSDLLFAEDPIISFAKVKAAGTDKGEDVNETLRSMLVNSGLFSKLPESAESASAIGGVYLKVAWDQDLSEYPIPVVEQADYSVPEFSFGILRRVHFWSDVTTVVTEDSSSKALSKIFRLIESYESDGSIVTTMWEGTGEKLGKDVTETLMKDKFPDIEPVVETGYGGVLAVYVPNMLPNKLDRTSYLGRSDLQGIENLMDGLDATFSNWLKDIYLAQARIFGPEEYFMKKGSDGKTVENRFAVNESFYSGLDMDPSTDGQKLYLSQFDIRSEQFEKASLNFIERIVTSAGFSPQSFGLQISGRAESGSALNIRERKSISTKNKKEKYWRPAIIKLVEMMLYIGKTKLGGEMDPNEKINVTFSDSVSQDLGETAKSLQMINAAQAASIRTKIKILHPEWSETQVEKEYNEINQETGGTTLVDNPDLAQFQAGKQSEDDEPTEGDDE